MPGVREALIVKAMKERGVSRQRKWQIKKRKLGLCSYCGKPRIHYKIKCDKCAMKIRLRERRNMGLKAWKAGGAGRPPVVK